MKKEPHKSLEETILKIEEGKVLDIFMHNGPDPDAMASALALKKIVEHYGKQCRIYYDEEMDFPANRLEVELLGLPFTKLSDPERAISEMDYVALVDVAGPGKISHYDLLYPKVIIDIDHHSSANKVKPSCFSYKNFSGACVSLLIDFMGKLKIKMDPKKDKTLAIASYLGLKTDTSGFYDKCMEKIDYKAKRIIDKILNEDDRKVIYEIEHPEIPKIWSIKLGEALVGMPKEGSSIYHHGLGLIDDAGIVPYVAEDLFRRSNFRTVVMYALCYRHDGSCYNSLRIRASGRSRDEHLDLGEIFSNVFYKNTGSRKSYCGSARKSTKFVTYAGAEIRLEEDDGIKCYQELRGRWSDWDFNITERMKRHEF